MKNKKWISLAAAVILAVTALPMTAFAAEKDGGEEKLTKVTLNEVAHSIFYAPQYVAIEKGYFERHIKRLVNDYRGRREKICRMFRESRLNEISTIYQDDAGTHFLLHVKTSLSDVEIKWAVRQKGILINCLSEYCFADADKYHGILVIHYSDMDEATLKLVIAAFEEIFL